MLRIKRLTMLVVLIVGVSVAAPALAVRCPSARTSLLTTAAGDASQL